MQGLDAIWVEKVRENGNLRIHIPQRRCAIPYLILSKPSVNSTEVPQASMIANVLSCAERQASMHPRKPVRTPATRTQPWLGFDKECRDFALPPLVSGGRVVAAVDRPSQRWGMVFFVFQVQVGPWY